MTLLPRILSYNGSNSSFPLITIFFFHLGFFDEVVEAPKN